MRSTRATRCDDSGSQAGATASEREEGPVTELKRAEAGF